MGVGKIQINNLEISRLIIGGNPFSGFSHQSPEKDLEMERYYAVAKIKETLKKAESLGINTHISRADHHVLRYFLEYRDEGGKIQWFAQTCPELGTMEQAVNNSIKGKATGCYIHGGNMDYLFAQDKLDCVSGIIKMIKDAGLVAGIAGHNPKVFLWAEEYIEVDFYMCSHYNPACRDKQAEHVSGTDEKFRSEDREAMVRIIGGLSKPVIHYKVMAAGRNDPIDTFKYLSKVVRKNDAVCIGVYTKDNPDMLEENIKLFEEYVR